MLLMRGESETADVVVLTVMLEPQDLLELPRGGYHDLNLNEYMPELNTKTRLLLAYSPDVKGLITVLEQHAGDRPVIRMREEALEWTIHATLNRNSPSEHRSVLDALTEMCREIDDTEKPAHHIRTRGSEDVPPRKKRK